MVGRGAVSLKYLDIASSKAIEHGSRGARLEISACVCTSMATSLATSSLGTYFDIGDLSGAGGGCHPELREAQYPGPGAGRQARRPRSWVPALAALGRDDSSRRRQRAFHEARIGGDRLEISERRLVGLGAPLLPVAQGADRD